jgi:hypothetical protein
MNVRIALLSMRRIELEHFQLRKKSIGRGVGASLVPAPPLELKL